MCSGGSFRRAETRWAVSERSEPSRPPSRGLRAAATRTRPGEGTGGRRRAYYYITRGGIRSNTIEQDTPDVRDRVKLFSRGVGHHLAIFPRKMMTNNLFGRVGHLGGSAMNPWRRSVAIRGRTRSGGRRERTVGRPMASIAKPRVRWLLWRIIQWERMMRFLVHALAVSQVLWVGHGCVRRLERLHRGRIFREPAALSP